MNVKANNLDIENPNSGPDTINTTATTIT